MIHKRFIKKTSRKQMIKLSDDVSRILKKIIITLLILLVCSQAAMQMDSVRYWLTGVDQWEGTHMN